uniref:JmjC domain-containing protein n=1 Tax=Steinernema glaseri TaxID=37863 RepID=A0A1I8A6P8_9BILA
MGCRIRNYNCCLPKVYKSLPSQYLRRTMVPNTPKFTETLRNIAAIAVVTALAQYYTSVHYNNQFMDLMKTSLRESCDRRDMPLIRAYMNMDTILKVAPRLNLSACVIPNDMSTVLRSIMCFLSDSESLSKANESDSTKNFTANICADKNEFASLESMYTSTGTMPENWTLLVITQEPLNRFLSVFLNECASENEGMQQKDNCYGCGKDVSCVLNRIYERAQSYAADPHGFPVTRQDYLFFPQNWHCSFGTYRWCYKLVPLETLEYLPDILQTAGVADSQVATIMAQSTSYKTNHSEFDFYHDIIISSSELRQLLHSIYFDDYEMFGYPFVYTERNVQLN